MFGFKRRWCELLLHGINLKKKAVVVFFILAILLVSLFFGQVIGRIYLSDLAGEKDGSDESGIISVPGNGVKKKVLRLGKVDYYTVQAGEYDRQEQALLLGKSLAGKGLPAVITGGSSYRVLLGFVSRAESLEPLAASIKVDGQQAVVVKGQLNSVAFKFQSGDKEAESLVAPFLGRVSLSLSKGLLLYSGIETGDVLLASLKPKFALLASELEDLAADGAADKGKLTDPGYQTAVGGLAEWCSRWASSLRMLEKNWEDSLLLKSQQQGLALLEEYHRFLAGTN